MKVRHHHWIIIIIIIIIIRGGARGYLCAPWHSSLSHVSQYMQTSMKSTLDVKKNIHRSFITMKNKNKLSYLKLCRIILSSICNITNCYFFNSMFSFFEIYIYIVNCLGLPFAWRGIDDKFETSKKQASKVFIYIYIYIIILL